MCIPASVGWTATTLFRSVDLASHSFSTETAAPLSLGRRDKARTDKPADRLELEVTETALIKNTPAATQCLNDVADMGVRIALDDFGVGYSNLAALDWADILKIDASLVEEIASDSISPPRIRG